MQTLFFQDAWKRAINQKDMDHIQTALQHLTIKDGISITFLWKAKNYKQEHLITAFIHNNSEDYFELMEVPIHFENDEINKIQLFTVPIAIPPHHSMPWTFIYNNEPNEILEAAYKIQ